MFDDNELDDVLFTFGVEKSGQLVLHNFPTSLMELRIPRHQAGGRKVTRNGVVSLRSEKAERSPTFSQETGAMLLQRSSQANWVAHLL